MSGHAKPRRDAIGSHPVPTPRSDLTRRRTIPGPSRSGELGHQRAPVDVGATRERPNIGFHAAAILPAFGYPVTAVALVLRARGSDTLAA
jgi:hypothetical protein